MEQFDEDLRKRGEKYFRDIISEEPDLIETLDSEFVDYEKLITTHIPDLDESQLQIIKETNESMITTEKVSDKFEFITIHRAKLKEDIIRIPNVSLNSEEPFITVENSNGSEEIINIHQLKKETTDNDVDG